jgi:prefoldin subunit 5
MNLATKAQVAYLTGQMEALSGKVDRLEKAIASNQTEKPYDAE